MKQSQTVGTEKAVKSLAHYMTPVRFVIYVSVLIFIASGWMWLQYTNNTSDRVFWDMVDNNLKASAFTRTVVRDNGQQKEVQVTQTQTTPLQLSNSQKDIVQSGATTARVTTESVGTPTTDFIRYTHVETSQKGADGKQLDFSGVQGVWGKAVPSSDKTNGQLYNEAVLSVIPFGNLTVEQRKQLISEMRSKNVYKLKSVATQGSGFRKTYVFTVDISASGYVSVLKRYAQFVGLTQLADLDPNQYDQSQSIPVQLKVDGLSHALKEISYNNGALVEQVTAFGSRKQLQTPPAKTISVDELQMRLQSVITTTQPRT